MGASLSSPNENTSSDYNRPKVGNNTVNISAALVSEEDIKKWKALLSQNPNTFQEAPHLVDKCFADFCYKHMDSQKLRWKAERRRNWKPDDPSLEPRLNEIIMKQHLEHYDYEEEKHDYKLKFESQLKKADSEAINSFQNYVDSMLNNTKLKENYFNLPPEVPTMANIKTAKLPTFMSQLRDMFSADGMSEEEIVDELLDLYNELNIGKGFNCRIIFCTLGNNDQNKPIENWFANALYKTMGLGSQFGLNHMGLQLGPYYIHWTQSNLVSIQKLSSKSAYVMIYPDETFRLKLTDTAKIDQLCKVIVGYNKSKYSNLSNNCQHFVMDALKAIGCNPKWIKDGPIELFVNNVKELNVGKNTLSFWDINGIKQIVTNHKGLRAICRTNEDIARIIEPNAELTPKEKELVSILKAIERALILEKGKMDDLIFPVRDSQFFVSAIV